jgi:hypothetical protein
MDRATNGEFINTIRYLSYHRNRFKGDSVVVFDKESHEIRGVMLAAAEEDGKTIISHCGTTFAGPVISLKSSINLVEEILDLILCYYEKKYERIELKVSPVHFGFQPNGMIDYFLLRRGYFYRMTGLSNIIHISRINSVDDALILCNSKRRNQIRNVIKKNKFQFKEKKLDEIVWQKMNENMMRKFGKQATHTFREIEQLYQMFPDYIRAFYVETYEGIYGAFGLVYCFKNIFHTQYLDLNYSFSKDSPNLLLILELIMKARELGYEYFSFGASTEKDGELLNYGLHQYKAEYGGGDIILPLYMKETV